MGTLIILALSNLATMLLTAWLLHRQKTGQSPMPTLTKAEAGGDEDTIDEENLVFKRGRPTL